MTEHEHDQALLSLLHPIGRVRLEAMVEAFVRTELPAETPGWLREAADMFEDAGVNNPPPQRFTGLLFAAALRERAAVLLH